MEREGGRDLSSTNYRQVKESRLRLVITPFSFLFRQAGGESGGFQYGESF